MAARDPRGGEVHFITTGGEMSINRWRMEDLTLDQLEALAETNTPQGALARARVRELREQLEKIRRMYADPRSSRPADSSAEERGPESGEGGK